MAINKQKKGEILNELKDWLKKSNIVIFANFHGLNTALTGEIRKLLKKADAKYLVAKKTLIRKALDEFSAEGGFKDEMPDLQGETAIIFGIADALSPIKALVKFGKAHPQISALGGVFEKAFVGKETILKLAKLPAREVLLAQLLGVINSPRQGLVGALSGVEKKFLNVLLQISKKK